jgi:predicted dinucleotide-binding enzyme
VRRRRLLFTGTRRTKRMTNVALLGAGGKMGLRLTANLARSDCRVSHVEIAERGRAALRGGGVEPVPLPVALAGADAVVLALPDNRIGAVLAGIDSLIRPGTMLVMLDVAAAYAGVLPQRTRRRHLVHHAPLPSARLLL